ncbi:MAG: hypothetical protein F4025_02500, partial [Synechococcus sp. SB0669_bin_7]|nr:hypothetical protein [Synechococcus sp. SB0675_bin_7]MYK85291.1 hypothetical protein [Synechococcus sp. SB0669_bin_7]
MTFTNPSNFSSMGPDRTIRYSLSGARERREVKAEGYFSGSPSEEPGKKNWKFIVKKGSISMIYREPSPNNSPNTYTHNQIKLDLLKDDFLRSTEGGSVLELVKDYEFNSPRVRTHNQKMRVAPRRTAERKI